MGITRLEQAMHAANERKIAAVGSEDDGLVIADTDTQDRAVFLGFDIDYSELVATSTQIAELYSRNAHSIGLRPLFISCWCDGLLTGLLLASLPPTSESSERNRSLDQGESNSDPGGRI
jgi:hypothetical protein